MTETTSTKPQVEIRRITHGPRIGMRILAWILYSVAIPLVPIGAYAYSLDTAGKPMSFSDIMGQVEIPAICMTLCAVAIGDLGMHRNQRLSKLTFTLIGVNAVFGLYAAMVTATLITRRIDGSPLDMNSIANHALVLIVSTIVITFFSTIVAEASNAG